MGGLASVSLILGKSLANAPKKSPMTGIMPTKPANLRIGALTFPQNFASGAQTLIIAFVSKNGSLGMTMKSVICASTALGLAATAATADG